MPVTVLDVADNRITQIKTRRQGRLCGRAGRVRQAPREPRAASRSPGTSPRRRWKRATCCANSASQARGARRPEGRRQDRRRDLQGRADGGRAGHDHRQGLRRRHQAPPLLARTARPHGNSITHTHAGLDRPARRIRAACSRQAHGGPPGQRHAHHAEPRRSCASTPSASCCMVKGCGAGLRRGATSSCDPVGQKAPDEEGRGAWKPAAAEADGQNRQRRPDHGTELIGDKGVSRNDGRERRCSRAISTRRWSTSSWSPMQANARMGTRKQKDRGEVQPFDQEALAPEGHRPRARRHDLQPAVARRRQDLPEYAATRTSRRR